MKGEIRTGIKLRDDEGSIFLTIALHGKLKNRCHVSYRILDEAYGWPAVVSAYFDCLKDELELRIAELVAMHRNEEITLLNRGGVPCVLEDDGQADEIDESYRSAFHPR